MRKLILTTGAFLGVLFAVPGNAHAQPVKPVPAGTISLHLNGYFQFGLDDVGSTFNNYGGMKLSPVSTNGSLRIYPGFDATTIGGISYGVYTDLRDAFYSGDKGSTANSASTSNGTIYVRRVYGYIGTPNYGYVRFGQTDGAFSLLQTGVIEAFGDGTQYASTDSTSAMVVPGNALPGQFIYADQGALYTTNKVVLISPAVREPYLGGKFSGIFSYEPNSNGLKEGYGSYCTMAGPTCAGVTSASTFTSTLATERNNTFDFMGQYAFKLGNFDSKISAGMIDGTPVRYTGALVTSSTTSGVVTYTGNYGYRLKELQVYQVGVQTIYHGLFTDTDAVTLGANIKWGQTLDAYAPAPDGARDALAYSVSGNYVIGPYVLGASFFDSQTAGNYVPYVVNAKTGAVTHSTEAGTLSEYGLAVGGNYVIGKDLSLYLQYLYAHRHQPGNGNLQNGNAQMQMVSLGGTFKW
ncbi:hypothetical protein [Acidocella aromatica]|uniref:Porin domain-containing protein n=1 Tax=Acidocella aromatica TaxID=1303579 RepID=A0A840VC27_9PROT|nr:hypothetical protein [Acidocella aromatica]MBB5372397.1 hypothetical protein [Acidocella aromatica]